MPLLDDPWLPAPDEDGVIPRVRPAAPVGVYRPDGTWLANVECAFVVHGEGTDPGSAGFRYNLASGLDGAPSTVEEALSASFSGPLVVDSGDRLIVKAQRPDGFVECLFDGYAVSFGMGMDPENEEARIEAIGRAWRAWDRPIGGAVMRSADTPTTVRDVPTHLVPHFNPEGRPNCTPTGYMSGSSSGDGDRRYPTFLDPLVVRTPDRRTYWTPSKAVRYLLATENGQQTYIKNPDGAFLDSLLDSLGGAGSPDGSAVPVPDLPVGGRDWPSVVQRIVGEIGVGMNFALVTLGDGTPETRLNLFPQQGGTIKQLYLAPRGTPFRPELFNFNAGSIARQVGDVVNQYRVEGGLTRHEISVVLAAGFPMSSGDSATQAAIEAYDKGTEGAGNKYRLYVLDETGEGHYAPGTTTRLTSIPNLDAVFGSPRGGLAAYVVRRRKPIGTLISVDVDKLPRKARLWISTDYAGTKPGLWDKTGTWREVTSTTWQLLPDRMGIRITDKNPETWEIGGTDGPGIPFTKGVVAAITNQATTASGKNFWLRLTCVVESDRVASGTATLGPGSPLPGAIERYVDARDRYRLDSVEVSSDYAAAGANAPDVKRDDTRQALAEAQALRSATEAGVLSGTVVVPRLTTYYKVGDRIGSIEGRGLGFRTDAGTGEPVYPAVVGVRHDFAGDSQTTTIELSDAGSDRRRHARPPRRKPLLDSRGRRRWNRRGQ